MHVKVFTPSSTIDIRQFYSLLACIILVYMHENCMQKKHK